jgi:deoxyribodipyrimidine photo-lyase
LTGIKPFGAGGPCNRRPGPLPAARKNRRMATALVWLKRDLRVADHAPLAAAGRFERAVALYVVEPAWLHSPEFDVQHLQFALDALAELRAQGLPLLLRAGPLPQVLQGLQRELGFTHLFSHEETGPLWSWDRDRAVAAWCRGAGVQWQEFAQTGVVRRLRSRSGWAARWAARMNAAPAPVPPAGAGVLAGVPGLDPGALPAAAAFGITSACRPLPAAGEAAAQALLHSFLQRRGADYRRTLSSPLAAEQGCSRLSPHLAFGTISMREVHQATEARITRLAGGDADERRFAQALRGFSGRLRWHCHFMQKLEDEPQIERRNFARSCDGLREAEFDAARLRAWSEGATGYPMVDACMRSLRATGWLNFRMRAMLVSFAAYHLWLHWREPGLHLARQFLDFEPGIHWSQMQMQSGTTGINTLRMYSPVKQAQDHDPEGRFIRRWLPELAGVPNARLAAPWTMSAAEQRAAGCRIGRDYPAPIVDHAAALAQARQRLVALRGTREARDEADAIQQRHGSRRSGLPPAGRGGRRDDPQVGRSDRAAKSRSADPRQAALFDDG